MSQVNVIKLAALGPFGLDLCGGSSASARCDLQVFFGPDAFWKVFRACWIVSKMFREVVSLSTHYVSKTPHAPDLRRIL